MAQALFVTVHTVEVHLSRTYAKLGIRSRTQLAGRLADAKCEGFRYFVEVAPRTRAIDTGP